MRSPRVLLAAGLSTSLAALSGAAAADDRVGGARSPLLVEREHAVAVEIDPGAAKLVVRRTVHNGGPRHDQATFWLDVPSSAVAINLRTLGTLDGKPHWFTGELMEAEAAAAKYRELTGIGGYYPKDPALLSWRHPGLLALQVFPCAPKEDKSIEYTLAMPTEYHGGRDHLLLPAMGTGDRRALAKFVSAQGGVVFAGDRRLLPEETVRLDGEIDLSVPRAQARPLAGALAVVPFGKGRVLLRQRIDAAPRVAEVPRAARVVVILDASRSIGGPNVAAQIAAARAYLSHFRDAEVATLLFDRRVTALHEGFVPVKKAIEELDRLTITPRNGSRADDALARAAALLAAVPSKHPRRVLLLTDALTRASVGVEAIRSLASRTGAVVHVGAVSDAAPEVSRDDDHAWAKAARATGGLAWHAGATRDPGRQAAMRAAFEEWARPKRIDKLRVQLPALDAKRFDYPDRLDEGEGFSDLRIVDGRVGWIKVEGELWSRPISAVLTPDEGEGKTAAALVFGSNELSHLSEPEMMILAKHGHAVSPVTSLLAIEPGVRPSTEGLETGEGGGGRGEGIGLGSIGTIGYGAGHGGVNHLQVLRDLLRPRWHACGGQGSKANVTVETTYSEVVDVRAVRVATGNAKLARCLEEAAWDAELPASFAMERWTFEVDL